MNQTSLICGSLAIDIIMQYEGRFGDTLLADQLHKVNVSFLVPTMRTEFGGCSGNIAYNLKLLGGDPRIVGVMGQDCAAYLERLQKLGISTQNILIKKDAYNAQCFVTADSDNNQINAFHPGAMSFAHENDVAKAGAALEAGSDGPTATFLAAEPDGYFSAFVPDAGHSILSIRQLQFVKNC